MSKLEDTMNTLLQTLVSKGVLSPEPTPKKKKINLGIAYQIPQLILANHHTFLD